MGRGWYLSTSLPTNGASTPLTTATGAISGADRACYERPHKHEAGDDPRSTAANGRAGLLAGRRRAGTCPPRTTRRRPCGSTRRPCAVCTALVRHARAARRRRHTGANTTSRSRCGGYRSGSAPAPAYRGRDHRRRPESGWRKAPPQHNAATRIRNRDRSIWYHAHRLIDLGQIWRRSLGAMWPD